MVSAHCRRLCRSTFCIINIKGVIQDITEAHQGINVFLVDQTFPVRSHVQKKRRTKSHRIEINLYQFFRRLWLLICMIEPSAPDADIDFRHRPHKVICISSARDIRLAVVQVIGILDPAHEIVVPQPLSVYGLPARVARIPRLIAYPAQRSAVILLIYDIRVQLFQLVPPSLDIIDRACLRIAARTVHPELYDRMLRVTVILKDLFDLFDISVIVIRRHVYGITGKILIPG